MAHRLPTLRLGARVQTLCLRTSGLAASLPSFLSSAVTLPLLSLSSAPSPSQACKVVQFMATSGAADLLLTHEPGIVAALEKIRSTASVEEVVLEADSALMSLWLSSLGFSTSDPQVRRPTVQKGNPTVPLYCTAFHCTVLYCAVLSCIHCETRYCRADRSLGPWRYWKLVGVRVAHPPGLGTHAVL